MNRMSPARFVTILFSILALAVGMWMLGYFIGQGNPNHPVSIHYITQTKQSLEAQAIDDCHDEATNHLNGNNFDTATSLGNCVASVVKSFESAEQHGQK